MFVPNFMKIKRGLDFLNQACAHCRTKAVWKRAWFTEIVLPGYIIMFGHSTKEWSVLPIAREFYYIK